jgi:hypothetical protein
MKKILKFFYGKSFYRMESICCANDTEFRLESNLGIDLKNRYFISGREKRSVNEYRIDF